MENNKEISEKTLKKGSNGAIVLMIHIICIIATIFGIGYQIANLFNVEIVLLFIVAFIIEMICFAGYKVLKPQEALVFTLFGKYTGTLKGQGFFFINPLSVSYNPAASTQLGQSADVNKNASKISAGSNGTQASYSFDKKISLKVMTLNNAKQKVNDALGNPVEIGVAVMWTVKDTAKAVFNVDNFKEYLSLQTDAAVRNIVKIYPYDISENVDTTGDGQPDDGSLRGSTTIVAQRIKEDIQERVEFAGLEIIDARITYLAYAPEIAQSMLQRQQASALVDARALIVDGAVGMVKMALEKLEGEHIVDLDDERKAAMVSNLLVVLCSHSEVNPVVNAGTLY